MSTGNYDHDNFVRVDCAVPASQFYLNAVHEVAHFTMIKQSFFGLLCFFLRQDTRDARSPLAPGLRTLEQAFECTNECYARTKELLLCTSFPSADPQERAALLDEQRAQPYYGRYHMERLEPILLSYDLAARCPLFPDRLFLMAAEVDVSRLLRCGFDPLNRLQALILDHPEELYPDHRLALLLSAFAALLRRHPPEQITEHCLAQAAGLSCHSLSTHSIGQFFRLLAATFPDRPSLQSLLADNLRRFSAMPYPAPTPDQLKDSFRLSLSDCVIPAALEPRFRLQQNQSPVFRPERNVLLIFLEPESLIPPQVYLTFQKSPRSAVLRFTDTRAACTFTDTYVPDLDDLRPLLETYPGALYLYLDDYALYHRLGPFRAAPVFFRADVPWMGLPPLLALQNFRMKRIFLQRYSDCAFFCFAYDSMGNALFSMLADWEIDKIHAALRDGAFLPCGPSDTDCYGAWPWYVFRDLIAAVTEDRAYGSMGYRAFRRLRLL